MNLKTPSEINRAIEQALQQLQNGQLDQATDTFEQILSKNPKQPDALHGMGLVLASQRQFKKAVLYFTQAVENAPQIAEFHNNLANAAKAAGDIDTALRHYHEALRLRPVYPQVHNNLGSLYYKLGKYQEASKQFEKSLRMHPNSVDNHYNAANCYIQLDRLLDAVAHFQAVLKLKPEHLGANHNLGITLCALKRFGEAKPHLEFIVQHEPNNLDALFHLGVVYSSLAEAKKAKATYEAVLDADPNHDRAHHNLATIYLHMNEKENALAHFKKAHQLNPKNKTATHMVAALSGETLKEGAPHEYTRALFDQYAYSYDEHMKKQLHYQVPSLLREMLTPFIQGQKTPWHIIDLGCGTGLCAPYFSDIAGKLTGVDLSPGMIEVAKSRGGYYKLIVSDIETYLEKHPNTFQCALAADVFGYFGELKRVFNAIFNTLTAEGLFLFSVEILNNSNEPFLLTPTEM